MHRASKSDRRSIPPWLLGLLLATVIALLIWGLAVWLGFGDDPAIGGVNPMWL